MFAAGEITKQVAQRSRTLRREHRLSGAALAARMSELGIPWNQATVAKLETGRRASITVDELVGLAAIFQTSTRYLLGENTCPTCRDAPPAGFTCNYCRKAGDDSAPGM